MLLQPYISRITCATLGFSEAERLKAYPLIAQYVRLFDGKLSGSKDFFTALLAITALYSQLSSKYDQLAIDGMDRHQWISDYLLTVVAGHESTAYLIGTVFLHGLHALRTHVGGSHTRIISALVTEALRFDSPVQLVGRQVRNDLPLNNQVLRAGHKVFLQIGAANRDERAFAEPGRFELGRHGPPPLAFGSGKYACIGRSLAFRAAVEFLMALVSQDVTLSVLRDRVVWSHGLAGRGLLALPLSVRQRTGFAFG